MAKRITLSRGLTAIVDDEDYDHVAQYKWYASVQRDKFYVRRSSPGNTNYKIYLHRYLMEPPKGFVVDHINGDPLDNRKVNLRVVTVKENNDNQKKQRESESGYRGVYRQSRNTWVAVYKRRRLGVYATKEAAAQRFGTY